MEDQKMWISYFIINIEDSSIGGVLLTMHCYLLCASVI